MGPEIKAAAKLLVSLATYTGLLIRVWTLPWSVSIKATLSGALLLVAMIIFMIARLATASRKIKRLENANLAFQEKLTESTQLLQQQIADAEVAKELEEGMVALAYLLRQTPTADDENHYYSVQETYSIDDSDGSYKYVLHGTREVEGTGEFLFLKVGGDAPADASSLVVEAIDLLKREPLNIAFTHDGEYLKVLQVIFKAPLEMGQEFKIMVTLGWPGTFPRSRRRDYLFSHWGLYAARGIDELTCRLSSDLEVKNVTLEEIKNGMREHSTTQHHKITRDHGRCDVTWVVKKPDSMYLLQFEKVYA